MQSLDGQKKVSEDENDKGEDVQEQASGVDQTSSA